jgi:Carbohydrate-binding module 48 (Isoamylase N-terminal domain)
MDIIGEGKRLSGLRTQEQRTGTPLGIRRVRPGRPYPLGATWDGRGVNFALYSENATRVELCLFDSAEAEREAIRIPLPEHTDQIWHVCICRKLRLVRSTVIGFMDPMIRHAVTASITIRSCSIRTLRRSRAGSGGMTLSSATAPAIQRGTFRLTNATARPMRHWQS